MSALPTIARKFAAQPGAGPIAVFQHTPGKFLEAMNFLYPELLDQKSSPMEHKLCAFRTTDGAFIGSFIVRMSGWGLCVAGPRKNPWFTDEGDWMLRAHLAGCQYTATFFYAGYCRKGWNYGMMRYFQRMGLGGQEIFNGRSIMTAFGTPQTRAALEGYIQEARHNYVRVRQLATERMKTLDSEEVLPRIEDFDSPVWSGDVKLQVN